MTHRLEPIRCAVLVAVAAVCLWAPPRAVARPPTDVAITYQGQLKKAGAPLGASVDVRFRLLDAASGGAQVGATLFLLNTTLANGLLTADLDFTDQSTPQPFNGDGRWIEVAVRSPAGVGSYIVLAPLQPVLAAPYALYALNPGPQGPTGPQGIPGPTGGQGATGAQGVQGATGPTGAQGVQGATGAQGGQGVQGATGATGAQGATGASPWALSGTDTYYSAGRVGVGTSTPSDSMTIVGTSTNALNASNTVGSVAVLGQNASNAATSAGVKGTSSGGAGRGVWAQYTGAGSGVGLLAETSSATGVGIQANASTDTGLALQTSGSIRITGTAGTTGLVFPDGSVQTSAFVSTGQSATTVLQTSALSMPNTSGGFFLIPGLAATINIPPNADVYISTDGGVATTSIASNGFSGTDIALFVDGVRSGAFFPLSNGGYHRCYAANSTSLTGVFVYWGMSYSIPSGTSGLVGSHTFQVAAAGGNTPGGSTANVGGISGSVTQGQITVVIIRR